MTSPPERIVMNRVTLPFADCLPRMRTSVRPTLRLVPSKARVQLSLSSFSQWEYCFASAGAATCPNSASARRPGHQDHQMTRTRTAFR
jgi:hypothetical protein